MPPAAPERSPDLWCPDAETRLVVLLGHPVAHSRSPHLHNTAFRHQGLNWVYLALPVAPVGLPAAVAGLRAMGIAGANVTIPHKEAIAPLLDVLTPVAEAVGAVNTIVCRRDAAGGLRLEGDNTDVAGFLAPLAPFAARVQGAEVVVLGAGGAARAVVYGLLTAFSPTRLTLVARREAQAAQLAEAFAAYDPGEALRTTTWAEAGPAVRTARLVVNATPVGMHPHPDASPWPEAADFTPDHLVYDLVYTPQMTRLLREAAGRGAATLGGFAMLLGQAAAAYAQWTGHPMPTDVVRAAMG